MTMTRYMKSMSAGGAAYARDDEGLTTEQMQKAVPALFATEAHESRSNRFRPIPSATVMEALRKEGFRPMFAQQQRTRKPGKAAFTRHMVRMRHPAYVNSDGLASEVIMINANDGTASWRLVSGCWRFVCANGLFIGTTKADVRVRHSGKLENVVQAVSEGAYEAIRLAAEDAEIIAQMRDTHLDHDGVTALATSVHQLRFPDAWQAPEPGAPLQFNRDFAPVEPLELAQPQRQADRADDLWTVFNVIEENARVGGQTGSILKGAKRRQATVRAVTGIQQAEQLGRAVRTRADRLLEALNTGM